MTVILQDLARFLQDKRPDLASCKINVVCKSLARSCKINVICKNLARSYKITVGVRLGLHNLSKYQLVEAIQVSYSLLNPIILLIVLRPFSEWITRLSRWIYKIV